MGEVRTIGLDVAKSVFQVHGVDVDGRSRDPQACEPRQGAGLLLDFPVLRCDLKLAQVPIIEAVIWVVEQWSRLVAPPTSAGWLAEKWVSPFE